MISGSNSGTRRALLSSTQTSRSWLHQCSSETASGAVSGADFGRTKSKGQGHGGPHHGAHATRVPHCARPCSHFATSHFDPTPTLQEVKGMADRIISMRSLLRQNLEQLGSKWTWVGALLLQESF